MKHPDDSNVNAPGSRVAAEASADIPVDWSSAPGKSRAGKPAERSARTTQSPPRLWQAAAGKPSACAATSARGGGERDRARRRRPAPALQHPHRPVARLDRQPQRCRRRVRRFAQGTERDAEALPVASSGRQTTQGAVVDLLWPAQHRTAGAGAQALFRSPHRIARCRLDHLQMSQLQPGGSQRVAFPS